MRLRAILLLAFPLLFITVAALAQEQTSPDATEQQALEALRSADQAFDNAKFSIAVPLYEQACRLFELLQSKQRLADTSLKLAETLDRLGRIDMAIEWANRALALHRELGDQPGTGLDVSEIALLQALKGNLREAQTLCGEALNIQEKTGNKRGMVEAKFAQGLIEYFKGEFEKSLEVLRECLRISEEIGLKEGITKSLNGIGMLQTSMGNLDEARPVLERALEIAVQENQTERIAQIRLNLGRVYWRQGDFSMALKQYNESLQIAEASGNVRGININLNNMALVYMDQGAYADALRAHERSLKICRETGDKRAMGISLENIGSLYLKIGNPGRALEYLNQGLELSLEFGNKHAIGSTRNNIGVAYAMEGNSQAALDCHTKALGVFEEIKDKRGIVTSHYYIGINQMELGHFSLALEHQQKALEIAKEMMDRKWLAMTLSSFGTIYYRTAEWAKATEYLDESIRISQESGFSETLWSSLHTLGLVQKSEGNTDLAIQSLKAAVDVIEDVRHNLQLEEEKASFLGNKLQIYSDLIGLLAQSNNPREAFEYAEGSRARAFLDVLAEAGIDPNGNLDPDLAKRKRTVESRYADIQKNLRSIQDKGNSDSQAGVIRKLENERQVLEEQYSNLSREIRAKNPEYADLAYPRPMKSGQVQAMLEAGSILLEYSLGKEKSYLFLVTGDSVEAVPLAGESRIAPLVQEFRKLILKPEPAWESVEGSRTKLIKSARGLYSLLIQPAEPMLQNKKRLIVVPDGVLNYLPFEALIRNRGSEKITDFSRLPYLMTQYELYYAPSATVLSTIRARAEKAQQPGRKDFIAFADPDYGVKSDALSPENDIYRMAEALGSLSSLPNTRREVEEIAKLFPRSSVTEFLGKAASEKNVKGSRLDEYRYVHFAAHGLIREDEPQYSSLVLSFNHAEKEDGLLMMREIFDLKLNADLVVLSACKTGLGQQIQGEGVRGLSRAFIYAGTPSVLVSLWNVSDRSTADFMGLVYRNLERAKMNKAAAVRQARLDLMRIRQYSHPFYWAPFVLIGNP